MLFRSSYFNPYNLLTKGRFVKPKVTAKSRWGGRLWGRVMVPGVGAGLEHPLCGYPSPGRALAHFRGALLLHSRWRISLLGNTLERQR